MVVRGGTNISHKHKHTGRAYRDTSIAARARVSVDYDADGKLLWDKIVIAVLHRLQNTHTHHHHLLAEPERDVRDCAVVARVVLRCDVIIMLQYTDSVCVCINGEKITVMVLHATRVE